LRTYVTFGRVHRHVINGVVFDKDCVALIEHEPLKDSRPVVSKYFGLAFSFDYPEKYFKPEMMKYHPRGIITINDIKN